MIIDITGLELLPGNFGKDCPGNGFHFDESGNPIECCCDACNYMLCCFEKLNINECLNCTDPDCPSAGRET